MNKIFRGFGFAFKGLSYAFATQINFKIHVFLAFCACLSGFLLGISNAEWIWICACIGWVLAMELLNTAIEVLVDLVSPDYHVKAGIIKDVAAAAVLLSALVSVIIGGIIFIPYLCNYAS